MTTPFERTRALVYAGDVLEEILVMPQGSIPETLREQARRVLRHYPSAMEITSMAQSAQRPSVLGSMLDPEGVPADAPKGYRR